MLLEDAVGRPIDRADNFGQSDVRLSGSVRASSYYIAIAANDSPEPLLYTVRTEFEPLPPPPPKPEPRFEPHPTAVLEIIGFGDNPEAVLIELGAGQGMRRGLRGRLLTDERESGEIGIDEVYSDGSRAGGTTPYVHGAVRIAKDRGAVTGLIMCVTGQQ